MNVNERNNLTRMGEAMDTSEPLEVAAGTPPVAGYIGWWDASDAASVTDAGAGAVSQWADKSGNGYHFTAAGSRRPTTGTRTINSLNVIDFDGVSPTGNGMDIATITIAQPVTYFWVVECDLAAAAVGSAQIFGNDSAPNQMIIYQLSDGSLNINAGSNVGGSSIDTNPHVWAATFNGASSTLHIDGVLTLSGNAGTQGFTAATPGLGYDSGVASSQWEGAIGEGVMYDSALIAGNRQSIEAYLKAKWGTP